MYLFIKQNKKAMRTTKKRISKPFLFSCLGLIIATITFANVERVFDVPDPPGRPSAFDIEKDCAQLRFKKPKNDGGSRIQFYTIEYKDIESNHWFFEKTVQPQYNIDDVIQCTVDNRVGVRPVSFRAFAKNAAGLSAPSKDSDPITFRDPF